MSSCKQSLEVSHPTKTRTSGQSEEELNMLHLNNVCEITWKTVKPVLT